METLELAIKMELESKHFYHKAAEKMGDKLGKELFTRLAQEEDFHVAKAREIADFMKLGEEPMAIEESLDQGIKIKSIFAKASKALESKRSVSAGETDAIKTALVMEEKSRKFYEDLTAKTTNSFAKRFFTALQGEERGHYLSLVNYQEYLTDPAGWFARTEHVSMDGG